MSKETKKNSEKDWSPLTYEQGVAAKNNPPTAYRASKVCAERAAWDFIEKEKPSFTIATVCEPMAFGPRLAGFKSLDDVNTSNASVWTFINSGKDAPIPEARGIMEIDVRDVAFAHVAALEKMTDTNERYLIAAGEWTYQKISRIVHESTLIPSSIKDITPISTHDQVLDHYQIESSKAQRELGVTYIPLKKTIEDLVLQLAQLQEILNK